MDNMLDFIDRLNHAIARRERETGERILKKDLAAAAGVSSSAVSLWFKPAEEGGTNELKAASILGLSKFLKVRVEWLRDREGPMRATEEDASVLAGTAPDAAATGMLSREAKRLIDMIRVADRESAASKETLNAFALIFSQAVDKKPTVIDLGSARSIERAENLVDSYGPKKTKDKGAA